MAANRKTPTDGDGGATDGTSIFDNIEEEVDFLMESCGGLLSSVAGTDTYTGSLVPTLTSYPSGSGLLSIGFIPPNTNTGASSININGLGSKSILNAAGNTLSAGDLVKGILYHLLYDGTAFRVLNLATDITSTLQSGIWVYDRTNNVDGANLTEDAWTKYPLDSEITNDIAGASFASNTITLPAGKYEVDAEIRVNGEEAYGLLRLYDDNAGEYLDTQTASLGYYPGDVSTIDVALDDNSTDERDEVNIPTGRNATQYGGTNYFVYTGREGTIRLFASISSESQIDLQLHYYVGNNGTWLNTPVANAGERLNIGSLDEFYGKVKVRRFLPFNGAAEVVLNGVTQGKHTIVIPATKMVPSDTNGARRIQINQTTEDKPDQGLLYDSSTQEFAHFKHTMPKSWDGNAVYVQVVWRDDGNAGSGVVRWRIWGRAIDDDGSLDSASGNSVAIDDTYHAIDDVHRSAEGSLSITNGDQYEEPYVAFVLERNASHASDTYSEDAVALEVKIHYNTDAYTDN